MLELLQVMQMITLLVADEDHVGGGRQVMSVGHGPHHEVSVFIMGLIMGP